jgi:hypothetical protein
VAQADLVVVEIVRGRDLHAAGAELGIDVVVSHDRNGSVRERQLHALADEVAIALVGRVHRDRGVAEHGLGPRGRDDQVIAGTFAGRSGDGIAQVPELAALLAAHDLEIGQGGMQHRVPVHEPLAAIDQPFVVEPHEYLEHRARQLGVHREALARPVDRCAEPPHLTNDRVPGALLPFPHARDEPLAAERLARSALALEEALYDHLRRNTCVIGAGLPQHVAPPHPVIARERVHDRVLERVAHVQRAGDVRRRDHDAIRRPAARRREIARRFPARVVLRLDLLRPIVLLHGRL